MKFFYSLGVNAYVAGIKVSSLWNKKASMWVAGRQDVWQQVENFKTDKKVVWFHCASLGEFEQGRPLMEALKAQEDVAIVLTFFSPSGYEIRKNYEGADLIVYLPKDSKKNAKRFLQAIHPEKIFFVKYEFWANYILEAKKLNKSVYSVAALFRENQIFFKWYGGYFRKILSAFDTLFVQNEASKKILQSIEVDSVVAGDPRYDRVTGNAAKVVQYPEIEEYIGSQKVLVCGSIWKEDLEVLFEKINQLNDWKIIIAPHEIEGVFIHEIIQKIKLKSVQYSVLTNQQNDANVLIIDNIGMLMNVYQYADVAYVGGGFKTGLHNILEPAAFGVPVIFGDKHEKFPEAKEFITNEVGFSVSGKEVLASVFDELASTNEKEKVKAFMAERTGATDKILKMI
ncbi:MAG: glycosyltransferase N-terminal domain-containing protein [Crocinitomicaceae bacterium]